MLWHLVIARITNGSELDENAMCDFLCIPHGPNKWHMTKTMDWNPDFTTCRTVADGPSRRNEENQSHYNIEW